MTNNRCKTVEDVQESLRAAVDDLCSDDVFDRIHALIYMTAVVKRLLSQFKRNYSGEIAREVDEMCKAVEEAFND